MVHGLWTHYFAAIGNFPTSHRYGERRPFPRYAHGAGLVDNDQRPATDVLYEGENMREEYEHWRNYNNLVQVNCPSTKTPRRVRDRNIGNRDDSDRDDSDRDNSDRDDGNRLEEGTPVTPIEGLVI